MPSLLKAAVLVAGTSASLALAAAPTIAAAQPYYGDRYYAYDECRHERANNAVAGAIIGGIAGALIGHGVSGYHERGSGTAAGAVIGGTAGAAIGSSSGCYHRHYYYYHRPRVYYYGEPRPYYAPPPYYYYGRPDYYPDYYYGRPYYDYGW